MGLPLSSEQGTENMNRHANPLFGLQKVVEIALDLVSALLLGGFNLFLFMMQ